MASSALDLTTIGHALNALSDEGIGAKGWHAVNSAQRDFLDWYEENRDEIAELDGLSAKASQDFRVLNEFLTAHGFAAKFEKFDDDSIGVVSILDMLVEWLTASSTTTITRYEQETGDLVDYPAFRIPGRGTTIYQLGNGIYAYRPLIELHTKSGHSLWLWVPLEAPASGIELATLAQRMLGAPRRVHSSWSIGVTVPMLQMNLDTNLEWLVDFATLPDWYIAQASQQFKLRANEKGARVKVASALMGTRSMSSDPKPYVFNRPFVGCFTLPGHPNIPLATFYADTDSWRNPEGALEEL